MGAFWFQLRKDKPASSGLCPIRIVYKESHKGAENRLYLSTGLTCHPDSWDAKQESAVFFNPGAKDPRRSESLLTKSEVIQLNQKLADLRRIHDAIVNQYALDQKTLRPSDFKREWQTRLSPESTLDDPQTDIVAFIRKFAGESGSTHRVGTLKAYRGLANHLEEYCKGRRKKAIFEAIDIPFLKGFQAFLTKDRETVQVNEEGIQSKRTVKAMNNITAAKQISTLKTLLNYARKEYKIKVNPDYKDFQVSRRDSGFEVIALTQAEFDALFLLDLTAHDRLARVRDIFCFSCASGLRYSDLLQLRREHIRGGAICMTAAKTGQRLEIPLNPFTSSILDKYAKDKDPLPMISNQKLNAYIKELCKLAGIDAPIEIVREYGVVKSNDVFPKWELVSIHTGRKTFTTLSLEKGVSPQDVMAMTGHTTWRSFKRYVDITSDKKKAAMTKAWGAPTILKKVI
jgi:integrase